MHMCDAVESSDSGGQWHIQH